ncbi:hypothetical protein [Streptomyces sp. NPDC056194]|uniref:hypothetical protein n=1 Tax=unclassified Streptomyces TaxID=2593676 RepID=UPI0035D6B0C6
MGEPAQQGDRVVHRHRLEEARVDLLHRRDRARRQRGTGLGDGGITLAPSAFTTRCVLLPGCPSGPPPCLVHPARAVGTLGERRAEPEDGLARLLGRSRAGLLGRTSTPTTTTGLALQTGLGMGAVPQHLAVLRDAGLVTPHRYRREAYHRASELGRALLGRTAAQGLSFGSGRIRERGLVHRTRFARSVPAP